MQQKLKNLLALKLMSNSFDFSNYSRQSVKGILVIYIGQIYKFLKISWILLFLIFKDLSKFSDVKTNYIYAGTVFLLMFLLGRAYLVYKNFLFKIEDEHFILKQGILKKTNTSIPFERIQNVNFKQNIFQQIINVFEVSLETAGSSKTEISIKAVSLQKAEALKKIITERAKGEVVIDEKQEKAKPLVKIGFLELLKVSLTENHLQSLFLLFAILIGFFQQIQQIFDGLGSRELLDGFIDKNTNAVSKSISVFVFFLILLIISAFISSFVKVILNHFNLVAYVRKDAFEINQGLFTKKSIILKKQKIQNITISSNPIKRIIGISFITFKQAVSGKINVKKNKLIRIVGCKIDQVETIKSSLFDVADLENSENKYPDNYYKKRLFYIIFLVTISFYVGFISVFQIYETLFSLIFVIPLFIFLILKKVKKKFYKITDSMLIVGSGLIETHFTYLEFFKVQNINLKQTIFQEKSKVADLIMQTASGKITIPCIKLEEAIKIYNHTLYKVETSQTAWM